MSVSGFDGIHNYNHCTGSNGTLIVETAGRVGGTGTLVAETAGRVGGTGTLVAETTS
jgi:hypothetical protein